MDGVMAFDHIHLISRDPKAAADAIVAEISQAVK